MKKKRKKNSPHKIATKRAWDAFSRYIRTKYMDKDGNCTCITCGAKKPAFGRGCIQAGHFVEGRKGEVLFNEEIVFPQCMTCNMRPTGKFPFGKSGNYIEYLKFMVRHTGRTAEDLMDWRDELKRKIRKYYISELKEIEEKYNKKTEELEKKFNK